MSYPRLINFIKAHLRV